MPTYSILAKTEAVELYESGLSCRAVAKHMEAKGVESPHFVTVLRWVKETGKGRKQRGRRFPIAGEIVLALYDRSVDVDEIAQRFRVGTTTVYNRLHEVGAKMRPSRIKYGHILTEERLRTLYLKKNLRAVEIASKLGCNAGTVYNWLRRNDIPVKRLR